MGSPIPLLSCSAALIYASRHLKLSVRVARGVEAGALLRPRRAGTAGAALEPGCGPRI